MYNIQNDIKNSIFSNVYIFCGEETYLGKYYTEKIISALIDEDTKEFNLMKIYNSLPDEAAVDTFANSYPFMSDKKILIIENTGIFKKIAEKQKNFYTELISNIPEYLIVIFLETETDKRSALYKLISKTYPVCEFEYQELSYLTRWISRIISDSKRNISTENASLVCEMAGPSMHALKTEADKLISYTPEGEEISEGIINTLVTRNIENRVFAMIDDIASGDSANALIKLSDLKALGEEPIRIINIIFNKFATYHKLLILKDRPMREICSMCGLYEKHARNNLQQAKKLGARKIANVMMKCHDMDFAVKGGTIDKWVATEIIIAEALL